MKGAGVDADGTVCHVGLEQDRTRLIEFVSSLRDGLFKCVFYRQTLQKYGRIDILVNNAAVNPHFGDLLDVRPAVLTLFFVDGSNLSAASGGGESMG